MPIYRQTPVPVHAKPDRQLATPRGFTTPMSATRPSGTVDGLRSGSASRSLAAIPAVDTGGRVAHPASALRPAAPTLGQPIQPMLSKLKSMVTGQNIVPEGVEELRSLGGGYGVGYHPEEQKVVMYNRDGRLAHVEISTHGDDQNLMLHTRTESGVQGGQGYMQAMFPEALKIIHRDFSHHPGIDMAPAPGAATKGLITHMTRLRSRIPVDLDSAGPVASSRQFLADRFMDLAESSRQRRRAARERASGSSSSSSGGARQDPQAWNAEMMGETTHELNALREMESIAPTGLRIHGLTGEWADQLVGPGTPLHYGGAWAWHKSASKTKQGMLQIQMDMAHLPDYIAALPDQD